MLLNEEKDARGEIRKDDLCLDREQQFELVFDIHGGEMAWGWGAGLNEPERMTAGKKGR